MRVLLSAMPAGGHFRPIVPLGHAALRAGHDVRVVTPDTAKDQVRAYGFEHLPAGRDWVSEDIERTADEPDIPGEKITEFLRTEGYPGAEAVRVARDILAHTRIWRPDVVVRENAEFGAYLAAEALGIPHVSIGAAGSSASYLDPEVLAPALDRGRAELGLEPDPAGARIHAYLHANLMPGEYDPGELAIPRVRCYRQESPARPGERLPDWVADLPEPPILAAFGTLHPRSAAWRPVTEAVIAGLGLLGRPAIVAVGSASFEALSSFDVPPSVRVVDRIPQPLALETASLFVHHGGFNSVRESVRAGVPMVVLPWFTDSLANADRCADAGVGLVVPKAKVTPEAIRDACAYVLATPSYRSRTEALRRRMLTLPPIETLLADVEGLVSVPGGSNRLSEFRTC